MTQRHCVLNLILRVLRFNETSISGLIVNILWEVENSYNIIGKMYRETVDLICRRIRRVSERENCIPCNIYFIRTDLSRFYRKGDSHILM